MSSLSAPASVRHETLNRAHFRGIEALRLIAALLVVTMHSQYYVQERLDPTIPVWDIGSLGVQIFFVISGFVMIVSTAKIQGTRGGWWKFGLRRIIRIVPLYWAATTAKLLALITVPSVVLHASLDPQATLLSYVFLPSRNIDGDVQPLLAVGWTLNLEMAFYAIFALALALRISPFWFSSAMLVIVAVASTLRPEAWPTWAFYFNPIVLYFLVGMIIGRWVQNRSKIGLIGLLAGVAVLRIAIAGADGVFSPTDFVESVTIVLVPLLIIGVIAAEPRLGPRIPSILLFGGSASYALYLLHPLVAPIAPALLAHLGLSWGVTAVILGITASLIVASLVYQLGEKPTTAWLNRRLLGAHPRSAARLQLSHT